MYDMSILCNLTVKSVVVFTYFKSFFNMLDLKYLK